MKNLTSSGARFELLADEYAAPLSDVRLMALNLHGLASADGDGRARVEVKLDSDAATEWHVIIPTGREMSPYRLRNDLLTLDGDPIGTVRLIEHDDARLGYLRASGRVMTMNTNKRSICTGCVFCPNTLADANDPRIAKSESDVQGWLNALLFELGWSDLSQLREINLSTGCFGEEGRAIAHLTDLRALLGKLGFRGRLGILSSVIRSAGAMAELAAIGPFALFLTLECLTRRGLLLKESKANLSPDEALRVLSRARDAGIDTGVMIVIGLDPLAEVVSWLTDAAEYLTDFPNLQIFQSHSPFMDVFRVEGADELEFFLRARRELELLFANAAVRPRRWQNYRPLWHYKFGAEPLPLRP